MLNTPRSLSSRYRWAYSPPPPVFFLFSCIEKRKRQTHVTRQSSRTNCTKKHVPSVPPVLETEKV